MHLHLDKYAYCNRLSKVHPLEKFLFAIITLLLCALLDSSAVSFFIIVLNSIIIIKKAGIKPLFYFQLMLLPFSFLIIGILTIAFNVINPDIKALFSFYVFNYQIGITEISLFQAKNVLLKALASVTCLYFLALTTPIIDIISVMRKFKIPELFLEITSLVYRFVFILLETVERIYNSQTSRLGYNSLRNSFNSLAMLISNLFIISFNRASQMFTALESRGYTGSINVLENEYVYSAKNIFSIILIEILIINLYLITR